MPLSTSTASAATPRFAMPTRHDARAVTWVKRVLIGLFCVHFKLAAWDMYKRIWQVLRADLYVSSTTVKAGATVSYDVITTGETYNVIQLELVQGAHTETLLRQRARLQAIATYDPRVFQYTPTITITPELLNRFAPGPATLRLTGFGGQKLL